MWDPLLVDHISSPARPRLARQERSGAMIVALAALGLTACSYLFPVSVTPSAAGPRFTIGSVRASIVQRRPGCPRMVTVRVVGSRDPLWVIQNSGHCPTVTSFVYGVVPKDWVERRPPARLRPRVHYEVAISAGGGIGSTGFLSDGTSLEHGLGTAR